MILPPDFLCVHGPMVIGVGPFTESLIDYLPQRLTLPPDARLYWFGDCNPDKLPADLQERLSEADCVLVMVDGSDFQAREQAGYWSQRLDEAKVYFHTTLILNASVNPEDKTWLQALHPPYIEVIQDDGLLDQLSVTFAFLPLMPFLQNKLCMYDASDLRLVLQTGIHAETTAIRWQNPEDITAQLAHAVSCLGQEGCKAALAGFNCSEGYTLEEFDAVNGLIGELVGEDVLLATLLLHSRDLVEGERELSVTLVYD